MDNLLCKRDCVFAQTPYRKTNDEIFGKLLTSKDGTAQRFDLTKK